jgi:hypothetical protein
MLGRDAVGEQAVLAGGWMIRPVVRDQVRARRRDRDTYRFGKELERDVRSGWDRGRSRRHQLRTDRRLGARATDLDVRDVFLVARQVFRRERNEDWTFDNLLWLGCWSRCRGARG